MFRGQDRRADFNLPFNDDEEAGYAFGYNPPYALIRPAE
jgi:hypothetical protein